MPGLIVPNKRTLREEVEELFDLAMDTGDIIDELRRRGRDFRSRSVIVMCSQLRLLGAYPKARPPDKPASMMHLQLEDDLRAYYDLLASERLIKPHDVAIRFMRWGADEDFVRHTPTLPPIGGI